MFNISYFSYVFQNKIDRFSSLSVDSTCNDIQYTNTIYLCAIAHIR